jgi:hypothetical protein
MVLEFKLFNEKNLKNLKLKGSNYSIGIYKCKKKKKKKKGKKCENNKGKK